MLRVGGYRLEALGWTRVVGASDVWSFVPRIRLILCKIDGNRNFVPGKLSIGGAGAGCAESYGNLQLDR